MATALLEAFSNRLIDLYRDADLIRDLCRLTIVERQSGFRLAAARDEHGHADRAMAMVLAVGRDWLREMQRMQREPDEIQVSTIAVV